MEPFTANIGSATTSPRRLRSVRPDPWASGERTWYRTVGVDRAVASRAADAVVVHLHERGDSRGRSRLRAACVSGANGGEHRCEQGVWWNAAVANVAGATFVRGGVLIKVPADVGGDPTA